MGLRRGRFVSWLLPALPLGGPCSGFDTRGPSLLAGRTPKRWRSSLTQRTRERKRRERDSVLSDEKEQARRSRGLTRCERRRRHQADRVVPRRRGGGARGISGQGS